ncbi:MAG: class I SAM-dependent methyltransferase, partial [Firmicutes bacterium]|nr:class I SAM-dependent methyltransferase [Bacillota bacterium]
MTLIMEMKGNDGMYTYPDKNDMLTIELIDKEFDSQYWADSEMELFPHVKEAIETLEGERKLLDLGCGLGRLFQAFAPMVDKIQALEPDKDRYQVASKAAAAFGGKVQVHHGDLTVLKDDTQRFDIVLMSHILQHIKEETIIGILEELESKTEPGALLMVTTTRANGKENQYFTEFWLDGARHVKETDKAGFEEAFDEGKVLPVCMLAEESIVRTFERHGFELVKTQYYHYEDHHDVAEDIFANESGIGEGARDVLYIFRKKKENNICANISYQFSFSYYREDRIEHVEIQPEVLKQRVRAAFPDCIFEDDEEASRHPFFKDVRAAQGFLHGGGLPFKNFRFLFDQYQLKFEEAEIGQSLAFMTIFPEVSIAQVQVCLNVKNCNEDLLVYLRHMQGNGRKLHNKDGRDLSIKEIYEEISKTLQCDISDMEETYLVEITKFNDYQSAEAVFADHARALYGMMCGDEGYRHVPQTLAEERLYSHCWGSRDFMKLAAFGSNTIFVNLNQSPMALEYRENRRSFDGQFYGDINPYFLIRSPYAGVNHGILFSTELVMVIKIISSRILSRQSALYHKAGGVLQQEIRKTKHFRGELITTLKRVENLSISEIGELEHVLLNGQQIEPLIDKIKYLLELLESELDLLYQSSTNRLVNILTVAGLLLSALGVYLNYLAII